MQTPNIKTTKAVVPMIYAYTTPEIRRHDGWTKIGYTEQKVETRIKQQTHTADVKWNLEWKGNAIFEDETGDRFTDNEFHVYLRQLGVEQDSGEDNEWFHITGPESRMKFYDFKMDRGILKTLGGVIPYHLRKEQEEAVSMTLEYWKNHPNGGILMECQASVRKDLSDL